MTTPRHPLTSFARATLVAGSLLTLPSCTGRDAAPSPLAVLNATLAAQSAMPGQMTVTGSAVLEVSPDCADITMTLSADGSKPGIATAAVQAKQQQLVAALATIGVITTDLKLSYLTLNPVYEPTSSGLAQLRVHAYRAEITITATTKKFDKVGTIMEAGADAGVGSMSTQFRPRRTRRARRRIRSGAPSGAWSRSPTIRVAPSSATSTSFSRRRTPRLEAPWAVRCSH